MFDGACRRCATCLSLAQNSLSLLILYPSFEDMKKAQSYLLRVCPIERIIILFRPASILLAGIIFADFAVF
jgi:hypothetical protein